jgi:hypothetical protein
MKDINSRLEEYIGIILENKIPENDFNQFAVEFYILTSQLLISLNKFLTIRKLRSPKVLQVKNAGELLYLSKDNIRIMDFLKENSYESIPQLTPQIAYYVIKKNKFTLEENWKNILRVLRDKENPSKVVSENKYKFTEEQKYIIKNEVKDRLNLEEHEINWILETIRKVKSRDRELFEKFKAIL